MHHIYKVTHAVYMIDNVLTNLPGELQWLMRRDAFDILHLYLCRVEMTWNGSTLYTSVFHINIHYLSAHVFNMQIITPLYCNCVIILLLSRNFIASDWSVRKAVNHLI